MSDKFKRLREECLAANLQLPQTGLVICTFGNVSVADRKLGVMAIKPSGVPYEKLKAEDVVILSLKDGSCLDGKLRPSSDTPTHLVLYREFPEISAIVHTHSTYATGWAQSGCDLPIYGTTHADYLPGPVPCTEFMADERIRNDYEVETGLQVVDCFRKRRLNAADFPMVLVAGHGPFCWGRTGKEAVHHALILEQLCQMAFVTRQVNPAAAPLKKSLIDKHFERKHGKNAYYGQASQEK